MKYEIESDISKEEFLKVYFKSSAQLHFHKSIEIIYCISGSMKVCCGPYVYDLKEGEIAYIPSCIPHSVIGQKESNLYLPFLVKESLFKAIAPQSKGIFYGKLDNRRVNEQIYSAMTLANDAYKKAKPNLFRGYVALILGLITDNYQQKVLSNVDNELILDIIEYVNKNYKEKITLEEISNHFGYSKFYFSRFFNKVFNCSLSFYVNHVRKEKVKEQVKKGVKMTSVIMDNGFGTVSSFYRTK